MRFEIYDKDPDMVRDTETLNVYILKRGALSLSGGPDPDEVWLDLFGEIDQRKEDEVALASEVERLDKAIQRAKKIAAEEGGLSMRLWQHLNDIELPSDEEESA